MYHRGRMDRDFTEDELNTFEGWVRYRYFNLTAMSSDELAKLRMVFDDDMMREKPSRRPLGRMNLNPMAPGELRYAVAIRETDGLWLVLWIRRSSKPAVFIMHPTGDKKRDVHTSYHRDGTLNIKSFRRVVIRSSKRQPLTPSFEG